MITVYRIKRSPEFMSGFINTLKLSEQLWGGDSDSQLRQLNSMLMHNEPLSPIWKQGVSSTFKKISPVSEKVPDISYWSGSMLLLNAGAYEMLKDRIGSEGEFLPITVDGKLMQIFNCLSSAREKEELCVQRYFQGNLLPGLETLYFDDEDVVDRFLFLSKLEGGKTLYCSSHFKALVEELEFEGLGFDEDLIGPF
ncbi:hypothetical protein OQJ46_04475 [Microbulbifer thermotolerans]|uniref:Chlorite dismutase n=1 Tax=Microbulbifer thermotolerans TaxID=252514 RepID=A0AB35I046_MICTH|nr:hypothetical protein [Microbulbifer thermotolerans]MCX2781102.1 hypothetical protein [Microbulbifer thermotolerans]MCX2782247.1 hypothetical protein [Microbulbifer thermotolerans]MCX2802417.1 hypothetical protein [Microbulbifer thermotolerans]MCX2804468.1 hypothetical protein [Microbulbifer thermotolerans]MCX2832342.1 hypothetical protein [Microbulbifer thermotolerans]